MRFLTDKKRVHGLGSARSGTKHHIGMTISSYGLIVLVPLFLIVVGPMVGQPYQDVVAHFARPFPALITGLTLLVGLIHFNNGIRMTFEDYVHGYKRELLIILTTIFCYGTAAFALFALARLSF